MSAASTLAKNIWNRFFYTGFSPERLGLSRILLGLGMIPFHILQFASLLRFDFGGPNFYFVEPIWYFEMLGIATIDPLGCVIAFAVLMIATAAFAAGLFTRASLATLLICILYLKGMRDSVAGDVHHRYLIPFAILSFFLLSRAGEIYSLDALRRSWRRASRVTSRAISEWEASWPIRAGQLYVCSFYMWSAIAKARMSGFGWIDSGTRLQHLLLQRSVRFGYEDGAVAGSSIAFDLAHNAALCQALAAMTYVFEFGFPLILFIRDTKLKLLFFAGVTLFHVMNFVLINVQFLFLPVVFLLFFDVTALLPTLRRLFDPKAGDPFGQRPHPVASGGDDSR